MTQALANGDLKAAARNAKARDDLRTSSRHQDRLDWVAMTMLMRFRETQPAERHEQAAYLDGLV